MRLRLFHSDWGNPGSKPVDNIMQTLRGNAWQHVAQILLSND
jgi:hypothetical protein